MALFYRKRLPQQNGDRRIHCKKFLRDSWIYFDQTLQGLCVFYVYKVFFPRLLFLFKERSFPVYSM